MHVAMQLWLIILIINNLIINLYVFWQFLHKSFRRKIRFVTALDFIKCLKYRDISLRAHLFLHYYPNVSTMQERVNKALLYDNCVFILL